MQFEVGVSDLPNTIKYEGQVKQAVGWTDKLGDHIIVTTETGEYPSRIEKEEGYRDAELFAYHYVLEEGIPKQTWRVYDFIKECVLDGSQLCKEYATYNRSGQQW